MAAKLTTHQSRTGEWRFRFWSNDGRVLASGEGYRTKEEMNRGIEEAAAVLLFTEAESIRDIPVEPRKPRPPS